MKGEDDLPRVVETDWRGGLPIGQGEIDGVARPGFRTFGDPVAAAIWYREEDDIVVVHRNDRMTPALRGKVDSAVTALRRQVANS